jgi:hypothetical protein
VELKKKIKSVPGDRDGLMHVKRCDVVAGIGKNSLHPRCKSRCLQLLTCFNVGSTF